jgi:hypothetical protein
MQIARVFVVGAMLSVAWPGHAATVRELGSAELRSIVSSGKTISLKRVVAAVAHSTQSEPIEARAFDAGGVFYRIVLKRQDGMLISVIIDAATGEQVKADSAIGKTVTQAATDTSARAMETRAAKAMEIRATTATETRATMATLAATETLATTRAQDWPSLEIFAPNTWN